jgi:hypothetical protein
MDNAVNRSEKAANATDAVSSQIVSYKVRIRGESLSVAKWATRGAPVQLESSRASYLDPFCMGETSAKSAQVQAEPNCAIAAVRAQVVHLRNSWLKGLSCIFWLGPRLSYPFF